MTHKEKQGLSVLAIFLAALLAIMLLYDKFCQHSDCTPLSAAGMLSATAPTADTISAPPVNETAPSDSQPTPTNTTVRKARKVKRPISAPDRNSPLDAPVNRLCD